VERGCTRLQWGRVYAPCPEITMTIDLQKVSVDASWVLFFQFINLNRMENG